MIAYIKTEIYNIIIVKTMAILGNKNKCQMRGNMNNTNTKKRNTRQNKEKTWTKHKTTKQW